MKAKVFICGGVLLLGSVACSTTPPAEPNNLCAVFTQKTAWHKHAKAMQKRWGVPLSVPMAMMYQESAYRANAKAPRNYALWIIPWGRKSSAYGYSQALKGTWKRYQQETGHYGADRDDFADAIDFMGWYIHRASKEAGIKKNDAYRQYLAYHEGWAGYKKGTYRKKGWLINVAKRVQQREQRYARQYAQCKDRLPKGFWESLF